MKSRVLTAIFMTAFFMTTGLIGCQKFESEKSSVATATSPASPVTAADIKGKTPSEVIQLKYAKLALACDLRLYYGKTFDPKTVAPIATLTFDMIDAAKRADKSVMSGNSADQTVTISAALQDFVVENDASVTAEFSLTSTVQGMNEIGVPSEETQVHKQAFRENVSTTVFSAKDLSDDGSFYFRQLDCTLQAAAR